MRSLLISSVLCIGGLFCHQARADYGLGFGYNELKSQEDLFQVDLSIGSAQPIGVIAGLKFVTLGSQAVDPVSGTALLLGNKATEPDNTYLFLVLPKAKTSISLLLASGTSNSVTYQQTFISPRTGEMFLLAYDQVQKINIVFQLSVNLSKATISLSKLGEIPGLQSFSAGAAKLIDYQEPHILIPGISSAGGSPGSNDAETSGEIFDFNITTGTTAVIDTTDRLDSLMTCDDPPAYFGFGNIRQVEDVKTYLYKVENDGRTSSASQIEDITSFLAGSAFCSSGKIYLIANDLVSEARLLFSFSPKTAETKTVSVNAELSFVGSIDKPSLIKNQASIQAAPKFKILKPSDVKGCAAKFKGKFKKGAVSLVRKLTTDLSRFSFKNVGSKYSCVLK